jgi:tetratricopeptide (TPR) repeat protein
MTAGLIARSVELERLVTLLKSAIAGRGGTAIISGETGIGKTRLMEELKGAASGMGFRILGGSCAHGISSAFMPFAEALKGGGLETLVAESAPKVISVYLTSNAGLVISKYERESSGLDADIFSSMLTAVNSFVQDSLSMLKQGGKVQSMNRLGYGNYTILIESSANAHLAVIIEGRENEFLLHDMNEALSEIQKSHGEVLKKWGGDIAQVSGTEEAIAGLVTSGKYDGIDVGTENPKLKHSLVMENVTRGLTRTAKDTPLLVVLDSLHWADSSSLALLHYLSRNIKESKIAIVGAYRPEESFSPDGKGEHPLTETLRLMSRDELYVKMELKRIDIDGISMLIKEYLGKFELPDGFVKDIFRESEGNPLFVIETLKLLTDEKILVQKDGVWELERGAVLKIPSKIYDIIMRRVSILPKELKEILECASVVGLEFTTQHIESIMKSDRMVLLRALRELESAYRIIRSKGTTYTFDHGKTRDVVYCEIMPELRMEYHRLVGDYIESRGPAGVPQYVPVLAHHYSNARDAKKAVKYLTPAAEDAKRNYANREAVKLYTSLIEFLEEGGTLAGKPDALESLAEVYSVTGEYGAAVASYTRAISILPEGAGKVSDIRRKIAIALFKKGDYDGAKASLASAMDDAKKSGSELEVARVYMDMGWVCGEQREYDIALDYCTQAAAILESHPEEKKDLAQLYNTFYVISYYRNDADNVLGFAQKSLKLREELGDRLGIASSYNALGIGYGMKGDTENETLWHEKSLMILEKIGDMSGLAGAYINTGDIKLRAGDMELARELYLKGLRLYEKLGDSLSIADACNNIAETYSVQGDWDIALEWQGRNLLLREKLGDTDGIARAYMNMGEIFKDRMSLDKALKYIGKGMVIAEKVGNRMYEAYSCNLLAECHLKLKDLTRALSYAKRSLETSRQYGFGTLECVSLRILGMAYSAVKKYDEAESYFKESISIRGGNDVELGRSSLEYGLFLLAKGNNNAGREKIEKAVEIFRKKNLKTDLIRATAALASGSA